MAKKNNTKSAARNSNSNNGARRHNRSGRKQTAKNDRRKDFVKEKEPEENPKDRAVRAAARALENGVHPGRYRRSGLDYLHSAIRAIENDADTWVHGQKLSAEEKRDAVLDIVQELHYARSHALNGDHNLAVDSCNAVLDVIHQATDSGLKRLKNLSVTITDRNGQPQHTRASEIVRRFRDKQMEGYELCTELLNARAEEAAEVIDRKMDPDDGSGVHCELHLAERFQYEGSSLVKRHPPRLVLRTATVKVRMTKVETAAERKAS